MTSDFTVTDHGTIVLLLPRTAPARAWVADHLPADALRWAGAVVVEPRYLDTIVDGILDDGLRVTAEEAR